MGNRSLSGAERAKVCLRYGVYPRTGWRNVPCYWCGSTAGRVAWSMNIGAKVGWASGWGVEFDHVIPLSKGGPNTAENSVLACRFCNRSRCNRDNPGERRHASYS